MSDHRQRLYQTLAEVLVFLEAETGQAPIVYGSLGVELALQRDYDAHDIDLILMDEVYEPKKITQIMRRHGYEVVPKPYLAYRKQGLEVEIANWAFWKQTVAFVDEPPEPVLVTGIPMRVLSLVNLQRLYAFLIHREGRTAAKNRRDLIKLTDLNQAIKERQKGNNRHPE